MNRELHRRLAAIRNVTTLRLRSVLRCCDDFDSIAGLAAEYERITGSKVNRGRLRKALDDLRDACDIRFTATNTGITVTVLGTAPPGPREHIPAMTAEEWRNSDAGRAEEAERQAELDADDAPTAPMPDDAKAWLEEKKRELERKRLEAEKLERDG